MLDDAIQNKILQELEIKLGLGKDKTQSSATIQESNIEQAYVIEPSDSECSKCIFKSSKYNSISRHVKKTYKR